MEVSGLKGAVAAVGVDRLDFAVGVDVVFIFAVAVVVCDMLVPLTQIVGGVAVGALFVAVALRIVGKAYNAAVASDLCRFVEPVVAYLYAVVVGHVAVSVVRVVSVARVCDGVDVCRVGYRFMRNFVIFCNTVYRSKVKSEAPTLFFPFPAMLYSL